MNKVDTYVQWLVDVANNNAKGYSQTRRDEMNEGDCSSWTIDVLRSVGYKLVGAVTTRDMYAPLIKDGFTDVTSKIDLNTGKGLKKGYICLRPATKYRGGHVVVLTDDNLHIFQAAGDFDGKRGDSSGKELLIRDYYITDASYKYVLAPPIEEAAVDKVLFAVNVIGDTWTHSKPNSLVSTRVGKPVEGTAAKPVRLGISEVIGTMGRIQNQPSVWITVNPNYPRVVRVK